MGMMVTVMGALSRQVSEKIVPNRIHFKTVCPMPSYGTLLDTNSTLRPGADDAARATQQKTLAG